MVDIVSPVVNGLVLGMLFALVGVGLTLVYGVLDIINLSHTGFLVIGAYITYFLADGAGLNPYLMIPVVFVLLFVFGYVLQRSLIQRVVGERQLFVFILTFGVAEIIRGGILAAVGPNLRKLDPNLPFGSIDFLGAAVGPANAVMVVGVLLFIAGLHAFLRYTKTGKAMRATRDDHFAAEVMGVDIPHIYAITMAVSAAMAGVSGVFLVTVQPVTPNAIVLWLAYAFIVVVIGGLGSVPGALLGGLVLGLMFSVFQYFIGSGVGLAVSFFLLVALLVVRPTGIMGIEHDIRH